jgi:two-component system sensor histidine kinase PilS (NtrC family)
MILGHATKLKQALLNIVINSYQSMEKTLMKSLEVRISKSETKIVLEVQDSGSGIPNENIHRIFEPFHTTKPRGTGLGLAITQKVLESHGALVNVTSGVGIGTTFRIEFPLNTH